MKKVVVTGGAGFIGSHIVEGLAEKKYRVTILDNFSIGKLENIAGLLNLDTVQLIRGSIADLSLLQELFRDVDYVFHLAALARVPQSIEDPYTTHEININGTLNVLMAARENKVKKVIYSSSSAVYGESTVLPQHEDTPLNPMSPYALTKLVGEYHCGIFNQIYGLPTISLRYFNVYGSRQDPYSTYANVIPIFIGRITQDLPPIIFDDGEQSRDFVFINDVVRANILAAQSTAQGIYNIGRSKSTTINHLVEVILKLMQKDLKPVYKKPRPGDPRHTLADIGRAKTFCFEPEFSLEDGLKLIIPYYSSCLNRAGHSAQQHQ